MSRPVKAVLLFLLLLTGLRLAYIGRVELSPDEAYYQMWSERLDWAYYSKGPGVALAIRAGTALFGDNEFGVRFFSPIFSLATSLVLLVFARRLYGDAVAVWTVLMLNLTPIFQAGSLLMTIDPLSIFFWSLGMFTTWLALERRRVRLPYWLATGVCVGLGFLSKYTNAMELLCILLAMASIPRWRRELRRPGFYVMLVVAVASSAPRRSSGTPTTPGSPSTTSTTGAASARPSTSPSRSSPTSSSPTSASTRRSSSSAWSWPSSGAGARPSRAVRLPARWNPPPRKPVSSWPSPCR